MKFVKNEILKLWILAKIRYSKCQKWAFENVNFWINWGFLFPSVPNSTFYNETHFLHFGDNSVKSLRYNGFSSPQLGFSVKSQEHKTCQLERLKAVLFLGTSPRLVFWHCTCDLSTDVSDFHGFNVNFQFSLLSVFWKRHVVKGRSRGVETESWIRRRSSRKR